MISGDIRRDRTIDTHQKYQEKVESAANMICQYKKRDHINEGCDYIAITVVGGVLHVSSYPLL